MVAVAANAIRADLVPVLAGEARRKAKMAASILEQVGRSLRDQNFAETAEQARLQAILRADGDLASLREALADRIAEGAIRLGDEGVCEHLLATAIDVVAIDQPRYATLKPMQASLAAFRAKPSPCAVVSRSS